MAGGLRTAMAWATPQQIKQAEKDQRRLCGEFQEPAGFRFHNKQEQKPEQPDVNQAWSPREFGF